MRSIETDGETIDAAIEAALRTLGLERERVEVEILASPTRGVLGFGAKPARIRATVRAPLVRSFDDLGQPIETPAVSRETERWPKPAAPPRPASRATAEGDVSGTPLAATAAAAPGSPPPEGERSPAVVAMPAPDAVARATDLLGRILQLLGVTCNVEARPGSDPGTLVLDVSGEASGLLIGHRGQMLDALEYMVNRIVGRDDDGARYVVDVERYRERRREYLDALARRLADKVRQSGKVVTLNPMTPRDRRIVHLALQGDDSVTTRSQGDGHLRKVLILPGERGKRVARPGRTPA